jgi:AcrR family transcriptional regulator
VRDITDEADVGYATFYRHYQSKDDLMLAVDDLAFPIELAANHMVAAIIGLIEWWLERELPLPVEEMARIYERLIIQATWIALPARNKLSLPWHSK